MFLSKRSNGIYYLWYEGDDGRRKSVSTRAKRKSDALKFLITFKSTEAAKLLKKQRLTLTQFLTEYESYSLGIHTPSSHSSAILVFGEFIKILGDRPISGIGVKEVDCFLSRKRLTISDITIRSYFGSLAAAFEVAKRWNYIVSNPFRLVKKPRAKELLPVHFTRDEFVAFIGNVKDPLWHDLYICAVLTGLRMSELTSLRWEDIDFSRNVMCVQSYEGFTTKSKKIRVVPMNEQVCSILLERNQVPTSELVFCLSGRKLEKDKVSKTFKEYVRGSSVNQKLHFHSLRHTFATWLVQSGASLYEVQKLMGHSSISTTQIYAHLSASELHGAVNRIAMRLQP